MKHMENHMKCCNYIILVGTRDVWTQSDRAQPARAQSACAQSARVVPLSQAQPARARAQCVPNLCRVPARAQD
jgi:hypothetical protein